MSFQDPPRRRRSKRYPALAQDEDGYPSYQNTSVDYGSGNGYQDGYQGSAGLAGTARQQPPWEDLPRPDGSDSGAQQSVRQSGAQQSLWSTGAQRSLSGTGAQQSVWSTGAQQKASGTGAQRSLRNSGAQQTAWDAAPQQLPHRTSGPFGAVPDDQGHGRPRHGAPSERRGSSGLLAGAIAGFLAAAVALGVANLVAAFVRPQASPIIAVGEAFIDRTPPALKNFAVEKFGENDKNMLLLGMYVTIAIIAIGIGMLAWRRLSVGVAGIGLFGLFGAFVAITRPDSHATDVIPSIVGGIAGITAIVLLVHSGARRPGYRSGRAA